MLFPAILTFRNETQIKTFLEKQKLREFIITRTALQTMLKAILPVEIKGYNMKAYESIKLTVSGRYLNS